MMSGRHGVVSVLLICLAIHSTPSHIAAQARTRLAIVGLDHDHVWGLLKIIANEPTPNCWQLPIRTPSW